MGLRAEAAARAEEAPVQQPARLQAGGLQQAEAPAPQPAREGRAGSDAVE